MARPIKETPTLTGKDAERFLIEMADAKPVSEEARQRAKSVFERFKAIATFTL